METCDRQIRQTFVGGETHRSGSVFLWWVGEVGVGWWVGGGGGKVVAGLTGLQKRRAKTNVMS